MLACYGITIKIGFPKKLNARNRSQFYSNSEDLDAP